MTIASTTPTRRRTVRILAVASLAGPVLGACGDDEPDAVEGTVAVTAVDYAYQGVPERVRAGATITLTNASDSEVHELIAIRLPDDEERPVSELVQLPPAELAPFFPGVETVLVAPPSTDGFVVEGTGALTEAGRYALICVIPIGADPDAYLAAAAASDGGPPDIAGGPPHTVEGMFAELVVVD